MHASSDLPPLHVIGLGMGEPLAPAAQEALESAQALAGGARLLERFPGPPGERVPLKAPLFQALDRLEALRGKGLRVAVLADGDPLFYGIGATLLERFGPDGLRFFPAVTSVQAACARLGLPWQDLPAVSLHGRHDTGPLFHALARQGRAAVLTGPESAPDALARLLLERGLDHAVLDVLENLGSPGERVRRLTPAQAAGERFAALNVAVVRAPEAPQGPPRLGIPDEDYESRGGLITKWPVRACALAALGLAPGMTVWDVGSGSGSVAVEASALAGPGQVWALERDPERHAMILRNVRRFGAWSVRAVLGEAPGAFADLPDPERIFLGGSLGGDSLEGAAVLDEACRRLRPGGRVVAAVVLLGSLALLRERFAALGWPTRTLQAQASLGQPLAGDERLAALNPVFIVRADKPLQTC
ncbi:Cobalamin biosynthesis bifunctional protein CbiET [Fundidesulfovibrio magnetotacticus]|uniref:Cobalamin biosynthesis bifunctional protein CbiET n=1 Tax=Fundidesulfovibrio magnetotacticus TaxID=2730080 RepID=A0A6V8LPE1_9BACT|nr:precorrin-6y C5,15-methyltransferase (decarboxylating) subunit CbiE [Fundidesulfovibrio magnetotacticus]GFK92860.1 Cobalamin biosynthesis bifunctional protein CbiET [Fundidesulfovibrio magnetotacticus]